MPKEILSCFAANHCAMMKARRQSMQFRKGEFDMSTLDQDKIYTSKSLQEEMNAERMLEGKEPLPAINPLRGGTGTLARKDRSWKNVPDFFIKAFKKK